MISSISRALQRRAAHRRLMNELHSAANATFPERKVLEGPFQGLEYPDWRGHGSAVFAKLLGTYEAELYPFVESVLASSPKTVIDIGCAEGFYAVGSARALPHAEVIAADLSVAARQLCSRMAKINGVAERIQVVGRVTRDDLLAFSAKPTGWLIADCEGGEAELFDENIFKSFAGWFILIEMHEFLVPGVEDRLITEALKTHAVEVIDSVDDYRRERRWPRPSVDAVPKQLRHEFYREGRPGLMRWICASPINFVS
jgi:hypothetical protein